MSHPTCRFCGSNLEFTFVDLGTAPLSNSYLNKSDLNGIEKRYPLHAYVCSACFLVQLEKFESPENIFSDYAYLSSYSDTWQKHCEAYAKAMIERFKLGDNSRVVELASNDGCMLQYFKKRSIPVLGIEPAKNVARVAEAAGIPTVTEFFSVDCAERLAREGTKADLLVANNVLAHVPDLNDFVEGMARILASSGVVTIEFPHLMRLIEHSEFDTIYHEHFSYFSFGTAITILEAHGLVVFDVEELTTHGGSLRIFCQRKESGTQAKTDRVESLLATEDRAGMTGVAYYTDFQYKADKVRDDLLAFLVETKRSGQKIAAYGAAAKANTLLNYAGVSSEFLPWIVDRNPSKQGRFMPGSRIPIVDEMRIETEKPEFMLLLPWNLREELMTQLAYIRAWGGRFVTAVPKLEVR